MQIMLKLKPIIDENVRLITTDRKLQTFMIGVFSLLVCIISYDWITNGFQNATACYDLAGKMLNGEFSYSDLGQDYPPLVLLLLIPPRLFSLNADMYCVLFSIYGFAFYMLGGHFMLKSCRETGFSECDAYVLLFLIFICSLSLMTLSTGPIAVAFVIISLWFYHIRNYTLAFCSLALATMAGFYPLFLFVFFLIQLGYGKELGRAKSGIVAYAIICVALLCFPFGLGFDLPEYATGFSLIGLLDTLFEVNIHSNTTVICSIFLTAIFTTCAAIRFKHREHSMREGALTLEISLIILSLLSPVYCPLYFIWTIMLFPMTQMTSEKFQDQKVTYLTLAVFCISTLVCENIIGIGNNGYECASAIRFLTLTLFGIQLCREFHSLI